MPGLLQDVRLQMADVTPHYFETLGIPIMEGRDFTRDDEKSPRVLIVDQTAASRYWPGQEVLGKKLRVRGKLFTVVGLVRNTKHFMGEQAEPMIYMDYEYFQNPGELIVQVKTEGDPLNLIPAVEEAIQSIDSQLPVYDVRTMRQATEGGSSFAVIQSTFAGVFAMIALVLAATGIYGVVAYRTQLRTHEIGIRVALGATRLDVLKLILIQGLWLTLCGLLGGLACVRFDARRRCPAIRGQCQ